MTTPDQSDLLRDRNVVAAIEFREARIYATDAQPGERPERVVAIDPRGRFHKVHHKAGNPDGTYEDDSPEYWEAITEALVPAGAILVLGHGKGKANTVQAITQRATQKLSVLRDAQFFALNPPPVRGLGQSSGFTMELLNTGGLSRDEFKTRLDKLLTTAGHDPVLTGVRQNSLEDAPTLQIVWRRRFG